MNSKLFRVLVFRVRVTTLVCVIMVTTNLYAQYRIKTSPLGLIRPFQSHSGEHNKLFETYRRGGGA